MGEEEDSRLGDFIEDRGAIAPAEAASDQLLKEQVEAVLDSLTGRERRVLQLRFGLETAEPALSRKWVRSSTSPGSASARSRPRRCASFAIRRGAASSRTTWIALGGSGAGREVARGEGVALRVAGREWRRPRRPAPRRARPRR